MYVVLYCDSVIVSYIIFFINVLIVRDVSVFCWLSCECVFITSVSFIIVLIVLYLY